MGSHITETCPIFPNRLRVGQPLGSTGKPIKRVHGNTMCVKHLKSMAGPEPKKQYETLQSHSAKFQIVPIESSAIVRQRTIWQTFGVTSDIVLGDWRPSATIFQISLKNIWSPNQCNNNLVFFLLYGFGGETQYFNIFFVQKQNLRISILEGFLHRGPSET